MAVSSTLLDLNSGLTAILNSSTVETLSTSAFVVHEGDMSNVTIMPKHLRWNSVIIQEVLVGL